jgi:phage terminase large subunit-like protein
LTDWHRQLEGVLRQVPGYDPWDLAGDAWLDHDAAAHAINWFAEKLRHVEGAARGEPFVLRAWQAAIVGNLFGWKRRDEAGRVVRRYRRSLIFVPRGNGKTPLAAGIVLYAFYEDGEAGAQCYLAAGQREQAGYLFRNAAGFIDQDPELTARATLYRGDQHRSIVLKDDPLSFCKVIPADAAGQHGGIPHITVVDELHVQENRDLLDVFETGMAKKVRPQPLLVMITTADVDRPSICNEVYEHACRVRDNAGDEAKPGHDPTFLPVIYEAGQDADWTDDAALERANPNLGVSVLAESLREARRKAKESPAFENAFRRLHLNQRTSQETRLISMDAWDACREPIELDALAGRPCVAGLDLASIEDLASLALLFPLEDERLAILSFSWCPSDKVERRKRQRYPYDVWARQGYGPDDPYLIPTPGDQIDYDAIREKFDELAQRFDVRQVGHDPHMATQFVHDLDKSYGYGRNDYVVKVMQSHAQLSAPTKDLIRRVKIGKVIHGGNPVLRWAAGNVAGYIKGKIPQGAKLEDFLDKVPVMPSKQMSNDKIDPITAVIVGLALLNADPAVGSSVYQSRGLVIL